MRIGIDIMGGDFAPHNTTKGAILALKQISSEVKLVLIGDTELITPILISSDIPAGNFEIVHATQSIEMVNNPSRHS